MLYPLQEYLFIAWHAGVGLSSISTRIDIVSGCKVVRCDAVVPFASLLFWLSSVEWMSIGLQLDNRLASSCLSDIGLGLYQFGRLLFLRNLQLSQILTYYLWKGETRSMWGNVSSIDVRERITCICRWCTCDYFTGKHIRESEDPNAERTKFVYNISGKDPYESVKTID